MSDISKHSTANYRPSTDPQVKQNIANFWKQMEEEKEKRRQEQTNQ